MLVYQRVTKRRCSMASMAMFESAEAGDTVANKLGMYTCLETVKASI
jgi:hypothetical protein